MILVVAWAIAAAVAIVVGAFCAYELRWKLARLRSDLAALDRTTDQLAALQATLAQTAGRASSLSSLSNLSNLATRS